MGQNYDQLFSHLAPVEPPAGLLAGILAKVEREQQKAFVRRKRHFFFTSLTLLVSAISLVQIFQMVQAGFSESGFFNFFSLLFSDFSVVVSYWDNFIISLLETLPVIKLTLLFAVILIFLEMLKLFAKDFKFISQSKQLTNNYKIYGF